MKVIHNKAKEKAEKKAIHDNLLAIASKDKEEAPLSHEEMLYKVSQIGTVIGREQAVIENLRRKGFNVQWKL